MNKKNIIIGIVATLVIVILAVSIGIMSFGEKAQTNYEGSNETSKDVSNKTITYFNSSAVSGDNLSFALQNTSNNSDKAVLIGLNIDGASQKLRVEDAKIRNDIIHDTEYKETDKLSIYVNSDYYYFEVEGVDYRKEGGKEYFDHPNLVLYKDENFYVAETNIDKVMLYYVYEKEYENERNGTVYARLSTISMGFYDDVDAAKQQIAKFENMAKVCVYNKTEGAKSCKDFNEYKNINDMIIELLVAQNLYIDSYENISSFKRDEIIMTKRSSLFNSKYEIEFKISLKSGIHEMNEQAKVIKLNGEECIIEKSFSLYYAYIQKNNMYLKILIDLPSDIEDTFENATAVLQEAFSK